MEVGLLETECRQLNEGFITRVTRRRPFAPLKMALSLDGRIAAAKPGSGWISSQPARELSHRWRNECDAVMVGAGTILVDDPRLTCRIEGCATRSESWWTPRCARLHRRRFTACARSPPRYSSPFPAGRAGAERNARRNVEIVAIRADRDRVEVGAMMRELAARGVSKILLEGGAHLAAAVLRARMVDRVAFLWRPKSSAPEFRLSRDLR